MSIAAIIFDYGKVLSFPPSQADWQHLAAPFGASLEVFDEHYWRCRPDYECGKIDGAEYWRQVAKSFGISLSAQQIENLVLWDSEQWATGNPEMIDFARRVHASGLKTAILSNMQHELYAFMIQRLPWLDEGIFDVQCYSHLAGIAKPDVKIYTDLCAQLAVDPAQALFLDDKQPNIDGARAAGLQAELFTGDRQAVERYLASQGVTLKDIDSKEVATAGSAR
jgi:putative hydrolase of the HAD superfamily